MEQGFLEVLKPLVEHCVNIARKYHRADTDIGKKLKFYNESLKILTNELKEGAEFPKIQSNIKSFKKLLKQLDEQTVTMSEGDFDDSWLWLRSAPCSIVYTKNGHQVDKIAMHLSDIYCWCRNVKERYELIILLFTVFTTVCADKILLKRLKIVITHYAGKIKKLPEEEILLLENDVAEEEEDDEAGITDRHTKGAAKAIKGVLGEIGLDGNALERIVSGKMPGTDSAESSESDEESSSAEPSSKNKKKD